MKITIKLTFSGIVSGNIEYNNGIQEKTIKE